MVNVVVATQNRDQRCKESSYYCPNWMTPDCQPSMGHSVPRVSQQGSWWRLQSVPGRKGLGVGIERAGLTRAQGTRLGVRDSHPLLCSERRTGPGLWGRKGWACGQAAGTQGRVHSAILSSPAGAPSQSSGIEVRSGSWGPGENPGRCMVCVHVYICECVCLILPFVYVLVCWSLSLYSQVEIQVFVFDVSICPCLWDLPCSDHSTSQGPGLYV